MTGSTVAVNEVLSDQVPWEGEGFVGALVNYGDDVAFDFADGKFKINANFSGF